ncbi:hypothetical protein SAMN05444344_1274 [Tenacibaculum mesophilum]|uniref:Uncharacterized protein n=1 Tax=Tenacibaculum mesophilum TaxID=104268 RepID=A0ABM7CGP3_9FLAO|nr:hypothetical protein [Tenacibaculum mesophilum]AZJ32964.1 hypothetical protein D6200_10525 [Tenacibaculum mesophilum]QFS28214.1 hypothetical protein F9Y86_07350 [Tenacibaculum mesophilum]SHF70216.1 hypothetical protein SAMN05444344_1274 [Tenacibaculum mesophilum]
MKQNKETLKQFFETGDKPTQQQYADLIDSYIDAKQPEGEANRRFVIDETGEVSIASQQQEPEYTLSPISGTNTVDLLKGGVSVSQIDLTPYLDNTNLVRLVSGTVDTNGLATFTRGDNSTFTVDFSGLNSGVIDPEDVTLDSSFDKQLFYNKTTKEFGFKTLIEKNPNYLVVDPNYSGNSAIGDYNSPFTNIKDACAAVELYDSTLETKFTFYLKSGQHTFDTLSSGSPMPKNIEIYTEANTTLIIDSPCVLNNSKFNFGNGGQLLFTSYGYLSYSGVGSHFISCDTIGVHKIDLRGAGTQVYSISVNNNFNGDININANSVLIGLDSTDSLRVDKRYFIGVITGSKIKDFSLKVNTYDASGIVGQFNNYMVRNINNEYGNIDISVNTVVCSDRSGRLVLTQHCVKQSGYLNVTVSEVTCNDLSFIILETAGNINNANLHLANAKINGAVYLINNTDFTNVITADDFFGVTITGSATCNPFSGVNSYFESLFAQSQLLTPASGVKRGFIHLKDLKLNFVDTPTYGGFLFVVKSNKSTVDAAKNQVRYILEDCEITTNNKELFRVFDNGESTSSVQNTVPQVEFLGVNRFDVGTATNLFRYDAAFYWDKTQNLLMNYGIILHNAVNSSFGDKRDIVTSNTRYIHKLN